MGNEKKNRSSWTDKPEKDTFLLEKLLDCVQRGLRVENGFKPSAWHKVAEEFNQKFNVSWADKQTFKTRYNIVSYHDLAYPSPFDCYTAFSLDQMCACFSWVLISFVFDSY